MRARTALFSPPPSRPPVRADAFHFLLQVRVMKKTIIRFNWLGKKTSYTIQLYLPRYEMFTERSEREGERCGEREVKLRDDDLFELFISS